MSRILREIAEDGAEHVRAAGKFARTEAVADALDLHRRHESEAFGKLRRDSGTGRRDEFMRLVNLPERNALEDFHCRGRGHWKNPVRAFHSAMSVIERRDEDFLHSKRLDADAREHDVRDGIERADLVEVDVLRTHAVDFTLRLGDAAENPERILLHERREIARLDQRADFPVRPSVDMLVRVLVMLMAVSVFIAVCMSVFVAMLMLVSV